MAYDYGFGELGNQLIELFRSGRPDFHEAEKLVQQGADLNASKENGENILSKILIGYWWSKYDDAFCEACDDCEQEDCTGCENNVDLNPDLGTSMCAIIRFFLAHGFDVSKRGGLVGARCLWELTLSTADRYMIEAIKLLLDAGAQNISVSPTNLYDTPQSFVGTESSFQSCEGDHALSNIYEAAWRVYEAQRCGRPYAGIDSYELAVGKKILKVLAEDEGGQPVFHPLSLPEFQAEHCFTRPLYLIYEDGLLVCDQYGCLWTDTVLPDRRLTDVSGYFPGVIGAAIREFTIRNHSTQKGSTHYSRPVTTIEMTGGCRMKLSTNFGQVKKEHQAAYFELLQ